jgi:hypothetical protein
MRIAQVSSEDSMAVQKSEAARFMEEMDLAVDPDLVFEKFLKSTFRWAIDCSAPVRGRNVK